jgi:signal transduction histidine kinase
MKRKWTELSGRYVTALRTHLKQGAGASLRPALGLGRRAVALGLETLDLARIHERAVTTLELSSSKNGFIKRAEIFFAEAITPIAETHRAARSILRRKSVEAALKKSGEHYTRLLEDSLQLQESLRRLTHWVLAAQEAERKKISIELQNEIAQTLLGINVRLVSLKQEARSNTRGLKNEIAGTQRLVAKSAESVRQAARGFGNL